MTEDGSVTPETPQAGPDDGFRPVAHDGEAGGAPEPAAPDATAPEPAHPPLPPLPPARTADAFVPPVVPAAVAPQAAPPAGPVTDPGFAAPAQAVPLVQATVVAAPVVAAPVAGPPAAAVSDARTPPADIPESAPGEAPGPAQAATEGLGWLAGGRVRVGVSPSAASFIAWVLEFVLLVAAAFLLATAIKTWVVQPFYIPSGSMEPTLAIGDRVLVNKFVYRFSSPKRGDVVVFESPEGPRTDLIKRVIAVGGQRVEIKDGYVYVDGVKLDEPYVARERRDNYTSPTPTKVPAGFVWVMGDNRGNSADSRVIGPQPLSAILGQAFAIYWPLPRMGGL